MTIKIIYKLYTDGDYSLNDCEKFGAREIGDYMYKGSFTVSNDKISAQMQARSYLEKFLCDGIHVLYTHHYLLMDFCLLVDSLIHEIYEPGEDIVTKELSGNYEGTVFTLIKEE